MLISSKTSERLLYLDKIIGTGKISKEDVAFLKREINKGNKQAKLIYGYYLLIDLKSEKKALDLIKIE